MQVRTVPRRILGLKEMTSLAQHISSKPSQGTVTVNRKVGCQRCLVFMQQFTQLGHDKVSDRIYFEVDESRWFTP
jgi:hypothetical protein